MKKKYKGLTLEIGEIKEIKESKRYNSKRGQKGFQKVESQRGERVTIRFTTEEIKEIEKVFGSDIPKSVLIRKVFMDWVKANKAN